MIYVSQLLGKNQLFKDFFYHEAFSFCYTNCYRALQRIDIVKNFSEMIEWINKNFSFAILNRVLSCNKNKFYFTCLKHDLVIVKLICYFLYNPSSFKEARTVEDWNITVLLYCNLIWNFSFWLTPTFCNFWRYFFFKFLWVGCIFNENHSYFHINSCLQWKFSK